MEPDAISTVIKELADDVTYVGLAALPDGTGTPPDRWRHHNAVVVLNQQHKIGADTRADYLWDAATAVAAQDDSESLRDELIALAVLCIRWADSITGDDQEVAA